MNKKENIESKKRFGNVIEAYYIHPIE
jgi:hypothetical protein